MFDFLGLGKKKKEEGTETTAPKPAITLGGPAPAATSPGGTVAIAPPAQAGQLLTSEGREVTAVVEDLEKEVERLKDSLNVVKESIKSVNTKLEEVEKTLGQLASIYEIVMNQLNPFLDEDERALPVRPTKTAKPEPKEEPPAKLPERKAPPAPQPKGEALLETVPEEVVLPKVDITNPKVIETIIDWVQFLVEKVGHSGIEELLQYYVDIRWISEEVKEILKRYADGIRVDIEPDVTTVQLDPEDHAKSLEYILTIKDLMSR